MAAISFEKMLASCKIMNCALYQGSSLISP